MSNKTGLPGSAQPWGRTVDDRLNKLERATGLQSDVLKEMQGAVDKTVTAKFTVAQQWLNGVGPAKVSLLTPTLVQFVSSTGLFEVTVAASGLCMAGATLGVSFESDEYPADIYYDIPKWGVVSGSANADVRYVPFSCSRSNVMSTRPGVYKFSLYAFVNTTLTASSQAFLEDAQISVKAV
jgi:hypothetical protein